MRVFMLFVALMAAAVPARAEKLVVDLAGRVPAATYSRPAGTMIQFVVRNRLPGESYKIVVEVRSIDIPALTAPTFGALASTDPCKPLLDDVKAVYAAKDEKALAQPMAHIRDAVAAGTCNANPAIALKLRDTIAATDLVVPGEYEVSAGEEIVLTISRGDAAWVTTISGGPRGKWLTTYGATVIPDKSRKMVLKGDAESGFVITPERDPEGPRVLPSVYFTWMSAPSQRRDWSHGPTAGLGVDDKAPGIFAGWSATYNQNLTFLAGISLAQHKRLRGQYAEGDVLKESLESDQLLEGVYKPTWMIGITFRFGDNPFAEAPAKSAGKKDGDGGKTP